MSHAPNRRRIKPQAFSHAMWSYYPETKGKTLEQIEMMMRGVTLDMAPVTDAPPPAGSLGCFGCA